MRTEDPWYDALASGWDDHDALSPAAGAPSPAAGAATAVAVPRPHPREGPPPAGADSCVGAAETVNTGPPGPVERREARDRAVRDARGDVYLAVQRSAAFRRVRRRYRNFALPVSVAFLVWYLAYVVAATAAPGLMARPVAGVFNVAMAAGLAQFASTFLLTWAYVRHARLRRDDLALELRWETQELARTRAAAGSALATVSSSPGREGTS
ncbi:DUF485 domain-containing protein [Streptomyces sp. HNM0575]|uniref:DUF485 domain-containing protein n=1 Tax=Streptomyces sp. HNM0575 TaxID=2716338 RepID=UPI00145E6CBC|nr:DUF485 domain-containing protein [Streptomyces sp. HNM0575]NLU73796.1 DUF485 domain-containing protein [Streptomyces sp. HNM0575]